MAIRARPDQVAELTRGVELPLTAITPTHLEILAEGLLHAFEHIRVREPRTVSHGSEAEVTALMEARLNRMVEQDPLWGQLVLCVARGKESISFDGSHLEKRPDLSIYLTDRTRCFPLVIEAKILQATTAKTELRYCDDGLCRFVKGEYAWGNREAFMIGYVRDGSSIDATLKPYLSIAMLRDPGRYLVEKLPVPVGSVASDLAYSRHGRNFVYSHEHRFKDVPGPISIWHLWLS